MTTTDLFSHWHSLIGVLVLAAIHWTAGWLQRPGGPRPGWLSAASGISVAYVFVDLLPDLAEAQERWLEARPDRPLEWLEHQVYVAALLGLLLYYAIARRGDSEKKVPRFWLDLTSFAVYNLVIGILASRLQSWLAIAIGTVAFGAHMLVNDYALQRKHAHLYAGPGRRILSASLLLGWGLGATLPVSELVATLLLGLVSGGIIFNVMKEEVPEERQGKLRPFVAGALVYAALLLVMFYSLAEYEP